MAVTVGIRELRGNLRAFLERVKAGDEVLVTDRGRPIARVVPPVDPLDRLIAEGRARPPRAPKRPIDVTKLPRLTPGKTAAEIVIEQRR